MPFSSHLPPRGTQNQALSATSQCSTLLNDAHPPQSATDGDPDTYWQSPSNVPRVDFTLDLGTLHEIEWIELVFNGPAPRKFVVQRSVATSPTDFQDYQYYSPACFDDFGIEAAVFIPPHESDNNEWQPACKTTGDPAAEPKIRFVSMSEPVLVNMVMPR